MRGEVVVFGRSTRTHRPRDLADVVGFVHQDPEAQFVVDRVEHDVAFVLENLGHDPVAAHLAEIPEVLEAYTITGTGDLLCRIVARSNADLQRVIDQIVSYEGIVRAATNIALAEQIRYRALPLVDSAVDA
jgi:DNA-binding Lrp family transcriptional regulator